MSKVIEEVKNRDLAHYVKSESGDVFYIDTVFIDIGKYLSYYETFITLHERRTDIVGSDLIFRFEDLDGAREFHNFMCANMELCNDYDLVEKATAKAIEICVHGGI